MTRVTRQSSRLQTAAERSRRTIITKEENGPAKGEETSDEEKTTEARKEEPVETKHELVKQETSVEAEEKKTIKAKKEEEDPIGKTYFKEELKQETLVDEKKIKVKKVEPLETRYDLVKQETLVDEGKKFKVKKERLKVRYILNRALFLFFYPSTSLCRDRKAIVNGRLPTSLANTA